jgi:NAD(P)-dependent dehydrogenase (short-subunit alcohol dehydrogenase family)
MSLANKALFITGGSRGIGLAIALRAARDGANNVWPKSRPWLATATASRAQNFADCAC